MGYEELKNRKRYMGKSGVTSFTITVTDDYMEAYIDIVGSGADLVLEDIVSAVKDMGITKGVSRKVVDNILAGKHGTDSILFAKGTRAQNGADGWFEFFFRKEIEKKPKILEDGSVDYQNVDWFEEVTKGQKIVEYHPAQDGVDGKNILGKTLPAKKGRDRQQIVGKGFTLSEDKCCYYANMGGRIEYNDNRIEISRLFTVNELSLATGNLEFDGSVLVRGNIGGGTVLRATEDIVIEGFVESAEIECGGSIMFKKGMNASSEDSDKGSVKAGEYVAGKFFEAVDIQCEGEIQADYFLNCHLFARKTVLVSGKKGNIAGGSAYAMEGFVTRNVGNRVGLKTYLKVGVNEQVLRKQLELSDNIKATVKNVDKLKLARNELETQLGKDVCLASEKYNGIVKVLDREEALLEDLYKKSENIDGYISKLRTAQIVVNNTLFDGVTCEINNQKYTASEVKNVTVKMTGNRIVVYHND